ncbi:MAG: nitroreductase family protein [Bacilli bacterium]|jgi:nitroreductase|nr:nitroreductase family protein [Bacilli bacterium]MDY0063976.1 nitroreductase family protein [Bacilli bacterium]
MDIINRRRSIRQFTDEPIEKEKIEALLRAAMQAPSAKNQQPWRYLVVQEEQRLQEMASLTPYSKLLGRAKAAIVVLTDTSNLSLPDMVAADMGATTQNILLEATSLGLGSCWIGVYGRAERVDATKQLLNLPAHFLPFSIVALGYPLHKEDLRFIDRFDPTKVFYEKI